MSFERSSTVPSLLETDTTRRCSRLLDTRGSWIENRPAGMSALLNTGTATSQGPREAAAHVCAGLDMLMSSRTDSSPCL